MKKLLKSKCVGALAVGILSAANVQAVILNFGIPTQEVAGSKWRYTNVGSDGIQAIDIVVELVATTGTPSAITVQNSGNDALLTVAGSRSAGNSPTGTFKWAFVETGTTIPYTVSGFHLGTSDYDYLAGSRKERFTVSGFSSYQVSTIPATEIEVVPVGGGLYKFQSTVATDVTETNQERWVQFDFTNVSEFQLTWGFDGMLVGPGTSDRAIYIDGSLDQVFTVPPPESDVDNLPSVPEPSIALLMGLGCVARMVRRKR